MVQKNKKLRISILMGTLALLIHGGLAYYVNQAHGFDLAIRAALAQGAGCFLATLCSSWLMQFFFDLGRSRWQRCCYASLGSGLIMTGVLAAIHSYNGTPELLHTLGAAIMLSTPYYIIFPLYLLKQLKGKSAEESEIKLWAFPYSFSEFMLVFKNNIFGPSAQHKKAISPVESPITINDIDPQLRIGFLGDLMPLHGRQVSLDPQLLKFLDGVDYLVANFEGSLFASERKGLLAQVHQNDILELIAQILPPEKTILSCANNHAADFGHENFKKNNRHLEALGFQVIGSVARPSVVVEGQIEITALTEWSNQKADYMCEFADITETSRSNHFQILYPHWCYELELYPNREQVVRAGELLETFDLIVGHHAHCPGVMGLHDTRQGKKMTAYSLGDFTFGVGGPVCQYFSWGQVMVAEFGPLVGARESTPWKQGATRWAYTQIVPAATFYGEARGRREQVVQLMEQCPWFT